MTPHRATWLASCCPPGLVRTAVELVVPRSMPTARFPCYWSIRVATRRQAPEAVGRCEPLQFCSRQQWCLARATL